MGNPQLPLELLDAIIDIVDTWGPVSRLKALQNCAQVSWALLISSRRRLFHSIVFDLGSDTEHPYGAFLDAHVLNLLQAILWDPCTSRGRAYPPLTSNIRHLELAFGDLHIDEITLHHVSSILCRLDHLEDFLLHSDGSFSVSESSVLRGIATMCKIAPLKSMRLLHLRGVPIHLLLACSHLQRLYFSGLSASPHDHHLLPHTTPDTNTNTPLPHLHLLRLNISCMDLLATYLTHPRGTHLFRNLKQIIADEIDVTGHEDAAPFLQLIRTVPALRTLWLEYTNIGKDPLNCLDISTLSSLSSLTFRIHHFTDLFAGSFTPLWILPTLTTHPTTIRSLTLIFESSLNPLSTPFSIYISLLFPPPSSLNPTLSWTEFDTYITTSPSYPLLQTLRIELIFDMTPLSEDELLVPWTQSAVEVEAEIKRLLRVHMPRCTKRGVLDVAVYLVLEDLEDESINSSDWDSGESVMGVEDE